MEEKTLQQQDSLFKLSKQLRDILDKVLATGDWQSSLFLKAAATKLRGLREKSNELYNKGNVASKVVTDVKLDSTRKAAPSGYLQVFILLYQVNGADLQGWYHNVKTLTDYSTTRPVYKEEGHVKEFIRSKVSGTERNGYVVVNVKESDFDDTAKQVDQFGHQLFILQQGSVKLENIVEFIHLNKKRYAIGVGELIYLGEI